MPKTTNDFQIEMAQRLYAKSGGVITDFTPYSVNAALCGALGHLGSEISYGLEQAVRDSFVSTAEGDALDDLILNRYGISRLGPQKWGLICWFYGSAGSVIPAGTEVTTQQADIVYLTDSEATITSEDHGRIRVLCVSERAGSNYYVPPYRINAFVDTAPAGVTKVVNRTPSVGGGDYESDAAYRSRAINRLALLEQETSDWYIARAQEFDPTIIRAFPRHDGDNPTIQVVRRNGTELSGADLANLVIYYDSHFLINPNRTVTVENAQYTDIAIEAKGQLVSGYTLSDVVENYATRLDALLSLLVVDPGVNVDRAKLIAELVNTGMFENVVEEQFLPASDVVVAANTLPRVVSINITDSAGNSLSEDHRSYIAI